MAKEYKKFKLVYGTEKRDIKGKLEGIDIKGSLSEIPTADDAVIVKAEDYAKKEVKLIYERPAKEKQDISELKASLTGIPAEGDRVIGTRRELEGIEVGEDDTKIEEKSVKAPEVKEEPAIATPKTTAKKTAKK